MPEKFPSFGKMKGGLEVMPSAVLLIIFATTPAWAKSNTLQPHNQLSHAALHKQQPDTVNMFDHLQASWVQKEPSVQAQPAPTRPVLVSCS